MIVKIFSAEKFVDQVLITYICALFVMQQTQRKIENNSLPLSRILKV